MDGRVEDLAELEDAVGPEELLPCDQFFIDTDDTISRGQASTVSQHVNRERSIHVLGRVDTFKQSKNALLSSKTLSLTNDSSLQPRSIYSKSLHPKFAPSDLSPKDFPVL